MGFINTATTITLTAKLTNIGRKRLLNENNNILSHFILAGVLLLLRIIITKYLSC